MLGALHAKSTERFDAVVAEVREAWLARMKTLLNQIGENVVLLWFSEDEMSDKKWSDYIGQLQVDPLFVTKSMIEELRPMVKDVVISRPSIASMARGTKGMLYPASQEKTASEMLGPECHREAAADIIPKLRNHLYDI